MVVEVESPGPLILGAGVKVDTCRIVSTRMAHSHLKSLRGFLGLTGYYRKFIKGYESIAAPSTSLLKKNSFEWSNLTQTAFEELKKAVTKPLVLRLPCFSKSFTVECDTSGNGLGVVLMQEGQPIVYFSKALKGRSLVLSTYEKELLALVTTV